MINSRLIAVLCVLMCSKIEATPYQPKFEGICEEYSKRRLDLVAKFLPDNPVIFEAGGHYGDDSVRLAARWPKSKVISFEANPSAFVKFLEKTKSIDTISGYNLAVNTYNGQACLNVCYGTTGDNPIFEGASSLLEASEGQKVHYQGPKIIVPCVVLDDWCKQKNIDHFDFMWLDLEGLELQILKSSPQILSKVKVIYTETNLFDFRIGMTRYADLKAFLEQSGFKLLSHWYTDGLQGDAIFVRSDLYNLAFQK